MSALRYGAATDVGQLRDHNEDAFLADGERGVFVVSDGMGGHAGGEIASAIVVDTFSEIAGRGGSLSDGIVRAHEAVLQAVADGKGKTGMGATAVALRTSGLRYEIAWAGDSRAYCWNGQFLLQLSVDHSFVQELVNQGAITAEEAEVHPRKNLITRAIGRGSATGELEADYITSEGREGWQILLCSDGLSGEVGDDEVADILRDGRAEQDTVDALIAAANRNGGSDNITAVLVTLCGD